MIVTTATGLVPSARTNGNRRGAWPGGSVPGGGLAPYGISGAWNPAGPVPGGGLGGIGASPGGRVPSGGLGAVIGSGVPRRGVIVVRCGPAT